ncbi:MAG: hypothetical protein K8S87_06050 [Planctomycetes bacterium]|nr:hypothetical protein [Planctomycetota bacterium]
MKKALMAITIVLVLSSMVIAQPMGIKDKNGDRPFKSDNENPRMKVKELSDEDREKLEKEMYERRIEMMKKILDAIKEKYELNDEQRKQLEDIFIKMMENQQKLRNKMKNELEAVKKKQEKELRKLLGDKYEAFKKELKRLEKSKQMGKPGRERESRMPLAKIAETLKLTKEQKKKFNKALEKMMKEINKLRDQAGKDGWTSKKMRGKIEVISTEFEKALKEILTVVQWEKYNDMKKRIVPGQPNRQGPNNRRQIDPDKIIEELGLSETQKKAFNKASKKFEKARAELMEILKNSGLSRKEIMEKMQALAEKYEAEIKKILTSEQLDKLKELQKKAAQALKGREPQPNQRRGGFESLLNTLELNEEQQKTIKEFFEDFREASEKLREERGNPEVMREKMQKIFQELIEKIKSQLNDEQKEKLEGWQKNAEDSKKPDGKEKPRRKMPKKPENPEE